METNKIINIENFQKFIIFLFFSFTYFFNNKIYLPATDYLNQHYVWKTIKREYYNFFDIDLLIPNFLDGYRYNYLTPSEFHLSSFFEYLLGVKNSELLSHTLGRLLIIYFSFLIFKKYSDNPVANITASTFIGVSFSWPVITLSFLAMVLSIFIFTKTKENKNSNTIFLILVLPFLYEIQLGGIFVAVFSFLILLNNYRFTDNKKKLILIIFGNVLFIFLNNYRLLYEIFFGAENVRSMSTGRIVDYSKLNIFFQDFLKVNIEGHHHISTSVKYFIFPIISVFFIIIIIKIISKTSLNNNELLFLKVYSIVQVCNILFALDRSIIDFNTLFGLRINLWRVVIFTHFLNGFLLLLAINKIKLKALILPIFISSFLLNGSAKAKITDPSTFDKMPDYLSVNLIDIGQKINYIDYLLMTEWNKKLPFLSTYDSFYFSPEDYYMQNAFNDYKKNNPNYLNSRFVTYDLDPMIAAYNNLYTLDGYFNMYEKDYNLRWRKVIEKELLASESSAKYYDNYAATVYLFITPKYPTFDLDNINFCELTQSFQATHLIASKEIEFINLENYKFMSIGYKSSDFVVYDLYSNGYC